MRKRLVANVVARILLIVCLIMVVPLAWALLDDRSSRESSAFAATILGGVALSLLVLVNLGVTRKETEELGAKEGLGVVGLSWIVLSLVGAFPFFLSGVVPSYSDAFFETASGFTTTGATIFMNVESLPRGLLFWRSLTHWLGGMGIIVLSVALLPALGRGAFQLYRAEAPGPTAERLRPRMKETAKVLWTVYFLLSAAETVLLMAGGMSLFDALCHTFGTMATGGFSTRNASIGAYGPYVHWVIVVFMFLAGTNFMLHYQALRGRPLTMFRSAEFRVYLSLVLLLVPLFAIIIAVGGTPSAAPLRESAFQVVSILTTTGYTTVDFDLWPQFLRATLVMLMFVGGCAGSTGGGMKVIRIHVAVKASYRTVLQAILPSAVLPVKVDRRPVSSVYIIGALTYFVIFVTLFVLGGAFLAVSEACDLETAFSASIAALGNIGPGLAKVGATGNYAWISAPGKWMLAFLMLAGRLELYSILVLLVPSTWRR